MSSVWVAFKQAILDKPSMTNLQRMQFVEQQCTSRGVPKRIFGNDILPNSIAFHIVLTEQIMRERANLPSTQVVVAPQASAQSSSSTKTITANNTQNVQNNQHNYNIQINQAPKQAPQPQKLATCNLQMRAAAAQYFLTKAGDRSKSEKVQKVYEKLIEGRMDNYVHKLLAEKAMLPESKPQRTLSPPTPPAPQPQPSPQMVQYLSPQPVQQQQQQVTTTTTTTSSIHHSSGGWVGSLSGWMGQQGRGPQGVEMAMGTANQLALGQHGGEGGGDGKEKRKHKHRHRGHVEKREYREKKEGRKG